MFFLQTLRFYFHLELKNILDIYIYQTLLSISLFLGVKPGSTSLQIPLCEGMEFFGYMLRSGIVASYGSSIFCL